MAELQSRCIEIHTRHLGWHSAILAIAFGLVECGSAFARTDSQIWIDFDIGGEISECWSGRVRTGIRSRDTARDIQTYLIDGKLTLRTTDWLNLSAAMRYLTNESNDARADEGRPYAGVTFKWSWRRLGFSNRNQFEYRFRDGAQNAFRYRTRLSVLLRRGITRHQVRPYVRVEAFLQEDSLDPFDAPRYRLTGGLRADPEDRITYAIKRRTGRELKVDLYYTYETNADAINAHIIGTRFGAFF